MILLAVVSLLVAALTWIAWIRVGAGLVYDLHKVPGPPAWPLIGNLNKIAGSSYLHKILAGWSEQYGPVYRWRFGPKDILVVTDPVEVSKLCSKEANLPKFALAYKPINTRWPHTNLLATPNHEEWRYVRRMLNPAFSPDSIHKAFPKVHQTAVQAADALHILSKQGPVEVHDFAKRITTDVITGFAFDEESGNLKLGKGFKGQMSFVSRPELEIEDQKVVDIRKQGVQPESNTQVWACLSRLFDYRDGSQLCNDAIAAQVQIISGAGFDTTANAITWALFKLAANQELQDRVRAELREASLTPDAQQPPTKQLEYADLSKLPWVDAVAKETLHLHSTAPNEREAKEDIVVMGYRIPKGTPLVMPLHALHVSSSNYLQPDKFLRERWLESNDVEHDADSKARGNRRAVGASWNPFSCGPRNCIGQSLAIAELRAVLAVLLSRFRFELPELRGDTSTMERVTMWRVTLQSSPRSLSHAMSEGIQRDKFLETEQSTWVTRQPRKGLPLKVASLTSQQTHRDPCCKIRRPFLQARKIFLTYQ